MNPRSALLLLLFLFITPHIHPQSNDWEWLIHSDTSGNGNASGLAVDYKNNYYIAGDYSELSFPIGDSVFYPEEGAINSFIASYDRDGNFRWAKSLEKVTGSMYGMVIDCRLAVDSHQNLYVAGEFDFTLDFGDTVLHSNSNWDVFVAKYSSDGQFRWAYQVGGPTDDQCGDLKIDYKDGIYLALSHGRPMFDNEVIYGNSDTVLQFHNYCAGILALDTNATLKWINAGTSEEDVVADNIFLYDNRHLFAQFYFFGELHYDMYVIQPDLEPITHIVFPFDDQGHAGAFRKFPFYWTAEMLIDLQSNYYVAGYFNDQFIINGDTLEPVNFYNYLIVKYNYLMEPIWYVTFPNDALLVMQMCADPEDGVLVSAPFYSEIQFGDTVFHIDDGLGLFIAGLGQDGNCRDATILESTQYIVCSNLATDLCDNIIMNGMFNGTVNIAGDTISVAGSKTAVFLTKKPVSTEVLYLGPDTSLLLTDSLVIRLPFDADTISWSDGSHGQELLFRASDYGPGIHEIGVYAENINGCAGTDTLSVTVIDNSTIDENEQVKCILFPNPADEMLHFRIINHDKYQEGKREAVITDINGKVQIIFPEISVHQENLLPVTSLSPGIYFLFLKNDGITVEAAKFIKLKTY